LYHIKNDRRALRSAEAIYEALVTLVGEKQFAAIKVKDIVEQAQIGRATFYRNFDVQEDVLRWRCDQVLDELLPYVASFLRAHVSTGGISLIKPILRFFYLDSRIIELLIEAERIDIFQVAFHKRLEGLIPSAVALLDVPEDDLVYWLVLRIAGLVSILAQWVKEGKRQAPDHLADRVTELSTMVDRLDPAAVERFLGILRPTHITGLERSARQSSQ
jgi:AcrR family transcriptional regulator